jgi:NADH-quinone oxidoreductase subunit A
MLNPYGNVFVFLAVGFGIVFATMVVVRIIGPYRPNPEKLTSYECGEKPIGPGWINFNARFYLIAILFIIFDVELILIFPVIANFRNYLLEGNGLLAFIEIFLFIAILFLGLIFAWGNKYLEWLWAVRKRLRVETGIVSIKEVLEENQERKKNND